MEGYFARIALILHLSRVGCGEAREEVIDERSAMAAGALVNYLKSHARRVYRRLHISREDKAAEQAMA